MKTAMAVLVLSLAGCGATMVSTRGNRPSAYAPTNETRGGTVKYMLHSLAGQRHDRESAYRKMHRFCDGQYRVVAEGNAPRGSTGAVIVPSAFGATAVNMHQPEYWFVSFECESEAQK